MYFVIDENVPLAAAAALRAAGHECHVVAESSAQATDVDVMALAREREAILVTFDADFGRLIFHEMQPPPAGVVFMRARPNQARNVADRFVELLGAGAVELIGRYIVIDMADVRSLPLRD